MKTCSCGLFFHVTAILALFPQVTTSFQCSSWHGEKPVPLRQRRFAGHTPQQGIAPSFGVVPNDHAPQHQHPFGGRVNPSLSSSRVRTRLGLSMASLGEPITSLASSLFRTSGSVPFIQAFGVNAVLFAVLSRKLSTMLTPTGFVHALALGSSLWATLGVSGWLYCVAYLFLGQAVTKVRFAEKQKAGLAEGRGGRRGPENVWGSAATGLLCAICSVQGPVLWGIRSELFVLGYVASIATKLADTFASEIGKAYGKTTFLITTLERVPAGTEGAVSVEGTAASVVGGLLLSLVAHGLGLIGSSWTAVALSTVAAFVATNVESLIGATLQEKEGLQWMTNEVVNFINTFIGATLAMVGGMALLSL